MPRSFVKLYIFLLCSCSVCPVFADESVERRAEVNTRLGSERSVTLMEIWAPLLQEQDRVLYGDVRIMGDDAENREGNLGIGYRRVVEDTVLGEGVVGVHGWVDRRTTARGNTFYQATAGGEWLGKNVDVRANVYLPLSEEKEALTPNVGRTNPYMAGTRIYVDTIGSTLEEPQTGMDAEFGVRLPFLEEYTDNVRAYGGGYSFDGPHTPTVVGWRTRVAADITKNIQVGARFQKDGERGAQGFLEATIRFPFDKKKSFREDGIRARLDESPERDIDIVTGEVVDTGLARPVLNAETGVVQQVLHVDNTATAGGDGSAEHPFNTLAAAQAAAQAHEIIYVHTGDGSSTGQNAGITLNKTGQRLIGAGTDFSWDGAKFAIGHSIQSAPDAITIAPATTAPVITNGAGNGIDVTADEVEVAGVKVNATTGNGLYALNNTGTTWHSVSVHDVTIQSSALRSLYIQSSGGGSCINTVNASDVIVTGGLSPLDAFYVNATGNGRIGEVSLQNITATLNSGFGVYIQADTNSWVGEVVAQNIFSTGNAKYGVTVGSYSGSIIESVSLQNISATSNTQYGVAIATTSGSRIGTVSLQDIVSTGNSSHGIYIVNTGAGSVMNTVTVQDSTSTGNNTQGFYARSSAGAKIDNISIQDLTATGNVLNGVYVAATTNGQISSATLQDITSTGNAQNGLYVNATDTSQINSATVQDITATGNALNGVFIDDDTTGIFNVDLGGGSLGSVGLSRIYSNTSQDIRVDLDGLQLKAENNWWGNIAGLLPARVTLDAGSTIDATPALTSDP